MVEISDQAYRQLWDVVTRMSLRRRPQPLDLTAWAQELDRISAQLRRLAHEQAEQAEGA